MSKNYEFGGSLYPNMDQYLDAVASTWIEADGANDDQFIADTLANWSDRELADECIDMWRLDQLGQDGEPSNMQRYDYTTDELAEAFSRYRLDRR